MVSLLPFLLTTLGMVVTGLAAHDRIAFVPSSRRSFAHRQRADLSALFQASPVHTTLDQPRSVKWTGIRPVAWNKFSLKSSRLDTSEHDNDDEEDEEEVTSEQESEERRRKRDRIKDWMSSSSSTSEPKVKPIRMEDGSIMEDPNSELPPHVKPKFDQLFAGMPSLSDIWGSSEAEVEESNAPSDSSTTSRRQKSRKPADETWFEEEKQRIIASYDDILQEMLAKLEQERQQDPEAVPENAEAMIKSVLSQEMDTEIKRTKESMALERLDAYQEEVLADAETKDISGPVDETMQKLMDDSEAEYQQQEASRLEVDEFLRYEAEAIRRATQEDEKKIPLPPKGADLDQWALERLEEMADSQQDVDGGEVILDVLEASVDDLKERIQKEANRGSIQPETMKEWQMYRAIATRLSAEDESSSSDKPNQEADAARENKILEQLESWKSYIEKENVTRDQSGLSRGPKLPFEWQEAWEKEKPPAVKDTRTRSEIRSELNRMSLEAMESLLDNTDGARREKLEKEIEYLKANIDSDVVSDEEPEADASPVDLSGVFSTVASVEGTRDTDFVQPPDRSFVSAPTDDKETAASPPDTPFFSDDSSASVPAPNTPFFSDDSLDEASKPPPPSTPFFANDDEETAELTEAEVGDSKLGSLEEQKLNAMFRKASIRNVEEQEALKSQWEEFQKIEQQAREQSGLSSDDDSGLYGKRDFNVSEVILEGGDIDAEKVLASIGPRPKRSSKKTDKEQPSPDEPEVSASSIKSARFRAVNAAGGGRLTDNPEAKANFEEFVEKEEELRQSLDAIEEAADDVSPSNVPFDDEEYAEEVIASLGARPKPKRTRIIDEGEFSDNGGVLASQDDEGFEEDEDEEQDELSAQDTEGPLGEGPLGDMPEWLRKENEAKGVERGAFLGNDIDQVFDDDLYEHNMRQLAEYERRRAGKKPQMGIDISDVLGRSALETDDYADFKYDDDYFRSKDSGGWGDETFKARKESLLDYREIDVREVNNLMDHKDSVYSTGVSQYLARINKPFKEFGAIFRLEGVLIDVTGLHMKAWTKVAEDHGFKVPELEDVRRAAITRPEVAVKEIFFWTDDFIECGKLALDHRIAFRQVFNDWIESTGETTKSASQGSLAMGAELIDADSSPAVAPSTEDNVPASQPQQTNAAKLDESSLMEIQYLAWCKVAEAFGFEAPTPEEVLAVITVGDFDIGIRNGFEWSDDAETVDKIIKSYRATVVDLINEQGGTQVVEVAPEVSSAKSVPVEEGPSADDIYQVAYDSWVEVAKKAEFEPPDAEQIQFALTVGPEEAVMTGFQWADDAEKVKELVQSYMDEVSTRRGKLTKPAGPETSEASTRADDDDSLDMFHVIPGAAKWVSSLIDNEMPCGIISYMDRDHVDVLLQKAGLDGLIATDKRVTADNGYNRDNFQMLGAALRLERRPDHCVVFDCSPYASVAAHMDEMQSVAIIGPYARYELLSADATTSSFQDLTAMNIRRLFGERIYDQPMVDTQQAEPKVRNSQKTRTQFWDDDL